MAEKVIVIRDKQQVKLAAHKLFAEAMLLKNYGAVKRVLNFLHREKAVHMPDYVKIETTNMCNGRCSYCPREKMTRPIGLMDENLFKKIAQDIKDSKIRSVHLQNYGEPLLDNNIFAKIAYLKEMGIKNVCIFTNGLLLDSLAIKNVLESGLDEIGISLDSDIEGVHNDSRRGLPFKKVVANIEELIRLRKSRLKPLKVILCSVVHSGNADGIAAFREKWKYLVDEIQIQNMHNWAQDAAANDKKGFFPCQRLWLTFTILWDGRVALCCVDFDGNFILGDLKKDSIADIWNNNKYREARLSHLAKDSSTLIELCRNCKLRLKDSSLWIKKAI